MGLSFFSEKDGRIVAAQMQRRNFERGLVLGVAVRCAWGAPQALLCRPVLRGKPFPTIFWLTCPHLTHVCGALESRGGVRELEQYLAPRAQCYRLYSFKYARVRLLLLSGTERAFLRRYSPRVWNVLRSTGIGGIRHGERPTVKCLHLQTAAALSLPGSPAKKWLAERLGSFCCENGQCVR